MAIQLGSLAGAMSGDGSSYSTGDEEVSQSGSSNKFGAKNISFGGSQIGGKSGGDNTLLYVGLAAAAVVAFFLLKGRK